MYSLLQLSATKVATHLYQLPVTLKRKDLATHGFQKKILTHSLQPAEAEPSFRKVGLPPANLRMFFPLTSRLESFGHKSAPSGRPWIVAYCPKLRSIVIYMVKLTKYACDLSPLVTQ